MNDNTRLKISKIILEYASKKHLPDRLFCLKIINLLVNEYNLKDYIKYYNFSNIPSCKSFASYYYLTKLFYFDLTSILNYLLTNKSLNLFNETSKYYYLALSTTLIILHEIEHVKQYQRISTLKTDFETSLLTYCNHHISLLNHNDLYNFLISWNIKPEIIKSYCEEIETICTNNSKINPVERLAHIYSSLDLIKIIPNISSIDKELKTYFELEIITNLLNGYSLNLLNPTETFLTKINMPDKYPLLLSKINNIPLLSKFKYGLTISKQEYKTLEIQKRTLKQNLNQ